MSSESFVMPIGPIDVADVGEKTLKTEVIYDASA